MAISTKRKRKFKYNGRLFLWYFKLEYEWDGVDFYHHVLHIISENKKFFIIYGLDQGKLSIPYMVVTGNEFGSLPDKYLPQRNKTGRLRIKTPSWTDETVTPELIKTIITWALSPKEKIEIVHKNNFDLKTEVIFEII